MAMHVNIYTYMMRSPKNKKKKKKKKHSSSPSDLNIIVSTCIK
jgi:hypothetical protein